VTAEVAAFDALRALKRERSGNALATLDQPEVDAFKAIIGRWERAPEPGNPTALDLSSKFFSSVRATFGQLAQSQVEGFQTLLQAFAVAQWPMSWAAYGWQRLGMRRTRRCSRRGSILSRDKAEAYRRGLRYYPWYGRGYVQLTWRGDDRQPAYGYVRADNDLDLAGALLADPGHGAAA
jgi:hypothetical protein